MFNMSMGVGEHIIRGAVVYVFLFLLLRFVGKKHRGELAPFDLLVLLILSETVQNSLVGDDTSLIGGLISAATLVGCASGMSFLTTANSQNGFSKARPNFSSDMDGYLHQNSRKPYAIKGMLTSAEYARRF